MAEEAATAATEGQQTVTKLELALKAAKMFVVAMTIGGCMRSVDTTEAYSWGLENSGYQNIDVIKDLTIPDIDMLHCLSSIHPGSPYSSDIVGGLIIALDMIKSATEKSKAKSQRTVLVLTDGCTPIMGSGDLPSVVEQMNLLNVEPIITTFGTHPLPEVHTVFEAFIAQSQQGQYLEGATLMGILKQIKSKDTQQISKCRVDMEITKYMKIPVWCYVKTSKVTLPTLKKESVDGGAPVKMDRAYFTVDDPDGEAIPAEESNNANLFA
ncbi:X-ray repair cross-complementing protein 5 [Perkinsus chesapeaki]|uniref:X-ray repair cross-complementing protein 5 n=1 Tax=Perkinsus chesapeaki TaxID=330153 RepID=A0A7J6MKQ3_PERCH|nr:X-ray repair cross-complementing protein 5 [Perkinsus chesapeaki]